MLASGSQSSIPLNVKQTRLSDDYRLLKLVGQGQFAQVYCAVHRRTGQLAAIKQTRHVREQISQEPAVIKGLNHPNIVRCQAISTTAIGYQLVLEYCEGGTLRSHLDTALDTASHLSLAETQALVGGILKGLSYLHQRGIVHGDLKPENIFLTYQRHAKQKGKQHIDQAGIDQAGIDQKSTNQSDIQQYPLPLPLVKIGDFGSARFITNPNRSRREIGSPTYAAPERFDGKSSTASDLYSVGVMLYELLLGDRPFSGHPDILKQAHQTKPVPFPPDLAPAARQLLSKALHKQPEQRFPTADAMLRALYQLTDPYHHPATSESLPSDLPQDSLNQSALPLSSHGITAPIASLLHIPQGCCIVTDRSLHVLTPRRELLSIARFRQPCWIAVSPDGRWFSAISKRGDIQQDNGSKRNSQAQNTFQQSSLKAHQSQGMIGHFSQRSGHRWRRAITLQGRLLTALCAQVIQVVALDARYLLRVSKTTTKTYLECFTRHGQFVGEFSLDLSLIQVTPTAIPYQLVALSAPTAQAPATVVVITLKPFQVRPIRLTIEPERVNSLPWGYLVSYQRKALLLDKAVRVTGILSEVPPAAAIAAIDQQKILLASTPPLHASLKLQNSSSTTPVYQPAVRQPTSLLVADMTELELGLIF